MGSLAFFIYLVRLLISDFKLPDPGLSTLSTCPLGLPVLRSSKISFPLFVSGLFVNSPFIFKRVPPCFPHMHVLRLSSSSLSLNVQTTLLSLRQ